MAVLENTIQSQQNQIQARQAQIEELKRKLDHMNEVFANAQRARFGQSSEKVSYVLSEDQICLFNEAEKEQDHKADEPTVETCTVKAHARKKKRTLEEMTANLPEKEILLELPEDQRICGKCGCTFKAIGKKFVRHELQVIPRQVKLLAYYTVTYACDHCEKDTGFAHLANVKPPVPLMKHSLASPSSVADVMAKKYADGLPLARQEKIWAREGVELSRATMANWVIQCSEVWLKPLYKHMKQRLLEQNVIHADETVVQVLKENGEPATSESRMWVYASGERSTTPIRIFEYQPDRSGKRPESFLRGFTGCLVTDGYSGYNQVQKVTHCGCWAHMKRKWREAMPDGATVKTSKANTLRLSSEFDDIGHIVCHCCSPCSCKLSCCSSQSSCLVSFRKSSASGTRDRDRPLSHLIWICPPSSIYSTVPRVPGGTAHLSSMWFNIRYWLFGEEKPRYRM